MVVDSCQHVVLDFTPKIYLYSPVNAKSELSRAVQRFRVYVIESYIVIIAVIVYDDYLNGVTHHPPSS